MDAAITPTRLGQSSSSPSPAVPPTSLPPSLHNQPLPPYSFPRQDEYPQEKAELDLYSQSHRVPPTSSHPATPHHTRPPYPYPYSTGSTATSSTYSRASSACTRPRGLLIANLLKPWTPIILYAITTLGFLVAISFWKAEVFGGLDKLSRWLKSDEYIGYASIFILIFLTTFPPLPLYSTLIILSGYTFGAWTGAVISYAASLTGALVVFMVSRTFFRASISRWLSCTITIKRVVKAIEKNPRLLFLIRLAPYPYNVMNCLLAASPSLTLRTYALCTALSLPKLIIHTSIGSSIRSFAQYHIVKPGESAPAAGDEGMLGHYSTVAGVVLCVAIFVYLSIVARRAVDGELGDDVQDSEETVAFLAHDDDGADMQEIMTDRPAFRVDDRFIFAGREESSIGL
ncbi:uncharacterized protein PHACADRAFT_250345 [Phanerochaete carnosa HHB-10118-sp]|uniref:Golgi apparatus membrane protein TVP38 n=1 Tax=Phanerochaete carnosa (strain HHB-10118-sp) TaxID=650164 RepID=K5W6W6_PHACS|nr:uncharacterized protein PHACADRAFT_250345 [Phanerochaete carnosa HHB-10118-sp]EKM59688.1 hypothetical protein PHACADRAFT_250345 [Phanerochaete carnosa HHB-10118-sp]